MAFERFESKIAAATDDDTQRALASEIGTWRAKHLTDVPALRDAAYAMSRIYVLLGDQDSARREAHSLVSLCQTPPEAAREELKTAQSWLASLGGKAVVARPSNRDDRSRTKKKGKTDNRGPSMRDLADQVNSGNLTGALAELDRRKGDRARLLATWARVKHIRNSDAGSREQLLKGLDARLSEFFYGTSGGAQKGEKRPEKAPKKEAAAKTDTDTELAKLLGAPVPHARSARVSQMEAWLDANHDRIDELASTALRDHVKERGPKRPAPWLFPFVVRALASGGEQTQRTIVALGDAYAVTAYREPQLRRLVAVVAEAFGDDWSVTDVRRGVLPKGGEPNALKVWTGRLSDGFNERMVAVAPETSLGELAGRVGARVANLAPIAVLWAVGDAHAELRAASEAAGVAAVADDDAGAVLTALKAAEAREIAAPAKADDSKRAPKAAPKAEPTAPKRDLKAELAAALTADELDATALQEIVGAYNRARYALSDGASVIIELDAAKRDARAAALLAAVHATTPEKVRLAQGISLGVDFAADAPDGEVAKLLTTGAAAERFGGAGVDVIIQLANALKASGWSLFRTFRGPTGREIRDDAVLAALEGSAESLWRLVVNKGEDKAEVWFLGADTPEARATIPRLLQRDEKRVVVLPVDPDLLSWYGTTAGPEAVGWTGEEADEVVAALA